MKKEIYTIDPIIKLLKKEKIATLPELKAVLNTNVDMTIFRKLKELSYRTSYSHRGKYYTLSEIADFDDLGLWSFNNVWFSVYRTLIETSRNFINKSEAGYSAAELESILNVEVKEALLHLFRKKFIYREDVSGIYIYFSIDTDIRRRQLAFRKEQETGRVLGISSRLTGVVSHEIKAAIILFFSLLNEKQRRLYAGLESLRLGHGGEKKIAELLDVDVHTIAKGREELMTGDLETERIRKAGGGRKPIEKKLQK